MKTRAVASLLFAVSAASAVAQEAGSKACATCHPAIYRSYMRTAMATSSGKTGSGAPFAENMAHSGFTNGAEQYSVARNGESLVLTIHSGDVTAERRLDYFVGSGHTGRSYITDFNGFLFESPASYYSLSAEWQLSPGYRALDEGRLLRPVERACLACHASRIREIAGTLNGFESPAFLDSGVSCERCHGPGQQHVTLMKSGHANRERAIVNPSKLIPAARDSICQQCHLAGEIRIAKATSRSWAPGDVLSDYVVAFVRPDLGPMQVNSHVERLAMSKCARAAGAKLWCGACHNVHSPPSETERIAYYRDRCMQCHAGKPCTAPSAERASKADNCIECHMPQSGVRDVEHAVFTDHSIPRVRRAPGTAPASTMSTLVPFGGATAGERERGLAYSTVAVNTGNRALGMQAVPLLEAALARTPHDAKIASLLAQLYDRMGRSSEACDLFQRAIADDPAAVKAAINAGTCAANHGDLPAAIRLWGGVLARAPGEESARLNLAVAEYRSGDPKSAAATLREGVALDPLWTRAKTMLAEIDLAAGAR